MEGRKESRKFYISVEGINCERLYFEHLQKLINETPESRYKVRFDIKPQTGPLSMAKRTIYKPDDKDRRGRSIEHFHIEDVEDYNDEDHQKRFWIVLQEAKEAHSRFGISYLLGYSNYTFELWMLLHVADMTASLTNREQYLKPINKYFNRSFSSLSDYKREKEFKKILKEYVTIETAKKAVCRADKIREQRRESNCKTYEFKGQSFYYDNPDTTVHDVVRRIFEVCELGD